jgi:ribosome-associated toxin RatA of RatAB toxin-antitoxin module
MSQHRSPLRTGALLSIAIASSGIAAAHGADSTSPAVRQVPACESRSMGGGLVFVRGRVDFETPVQAVYDVIADFDHLSEFVSAMDTSRVVGRDAKGVLVRQVGTARFVIKRNVRMTLRFQTRAPDLLRFEIVDGDFPVYYGAWRISERSGGSRLVYDVTMQPPAFVPQFLVRSLVEAILCRTLGEVWAEVARRAGVSDGDSALKAKAEAPDSTSPRE